MHLKNIEKILRLIPTTLIVISTLIAIIITYFLLQIQQQRDIDLLKQKKILENQFNKKELLQAFNMVVKNNIEHELTKVDKYLREHTFKVIGSIKHHLNNNNPELVKKCLQKYEDDNDVFIAVFEATELELIFGDKKIEFLAQLIFGSKEEYYKQIVLEYITSQGRYNLQEWRNDLAGTLKLSFFDKLVHKDKEYFVGSFSNLVDIRLITKNMIIQEINKQKKDSAYYIWYYDLLTGNSYNFENGKRVLSLEQVSGTFKKQINKRFFEEFSTKDIVEFETHSILHDSKNKLSIGINSTDGFIINEDSIYEKYQFLLIEYILIICIVSFLLIFTSRHFALFIKVQLDARELKQKVEEEVEKNRQKDRILIQQSKLAGMGEMLGNIAHQWRQPLNNVSLFLQFIESHYHDEKADKKAIEKYFRKSFVQINYMSQTIDDFRNFYRPSKQKSNFYLKEAVDSAIDIIGVQLKDGNIELINDIDHISIYSFENEFKQSLLNILSNAHQAIKARKEHSSFIPYIKISIKEVGNNIEIVISNNGGEIDETILPRIFEPYFTTKFESQGTGVGLYMTKSIIEVNLKGSIEVENFTDGVSFKIILPQEQKE